VTLIYNVGYRLAKLRRAVDHSWHRFDPNNVQSAESYNVVGAEDHRADLSVCCDFGN
jgi:hypothetical protein